MLKKFYLNLTILFVHNYIFYIFSFLAYNSFYFWLVYLGFLKIKFIKKKLKKKFSKENF